MRTPSNQAATSRAILGALVIATLSGCGGEEVVEQAPVARPVRILEIGGAGAGGTLEFPGLIAAGQEAEMAFEVSGKLIEFPVTEGEAVAAGVVLARLDPRDFEAARDADTASMKAAKAEYDRFQDLYANDAVSLQDLEAKRRQFEVTEAKLRTTTKALEDTRLVAPFAGKVARKLVDDFANVRAKQPILLLQDASGLEIKVNVPEQDAARTRQGARSESAQASFRVEVSSIPGRFFDARVKEFATAADPVTRTFEVTCSFAAPPDVNILPGMTAKLIVSGVGATSSGGAIRVPSKAVVAADDGSSFVWIVDPSSMKVSRRSVTLGQLTGADIEIRSGLAAGDQVAVTGASHLREGMEVRRLQN